MVPLDVVGWIEEGPERYPGCGGGGRGKVLGSGCSGRGRLPGCSGGGRHQDVAAKNVCPDMAVAMKDESWVVDVDVSIAGSRDSDCGDSGVSIYGDVGGGKLDGVWLSVKRLGRGDDDDFRDNDDWQR